MKIGGVIVEVQRKKTELHLSFQTGKTRFLVTTTPAEIKEWELFFAHERLLNHTHYDVLGVSPDASGEDIKKAYRKLAKALHPHVGGNEAKLKEVNAAYEILSDSVRRQQYDESVCR